MKLKVLSLFTIVFSFLNSANGATFTVTNTAGNGWWPANGDPGSLKRAISDAALSPGKDIIVFDLPPGSQITSAQDPLVVDNEVEIIGDDNSGTGSSVSLRASLSVSAANVEIRNLDFVTTSVHSLAITGNNCLIYECSFASSGGFQNAIWVNGGTNSIIRKNSITASDLHAISIENGGSHTVDSNTVTGSKDVGIIARGTGNNTITENSVSGGSHNGIGIIASNNTISSNEVFNNARAGIAVVGGTGNTIDGNKVYRNNTNFWMGGSGPVPEQGAIHSDAANTTIENNYVYANGANGILVNTATGTGAIIRNNVVGRDDIGTESGNGWNGIFVWQGNNSTITGNIVVNNGGGASHTTYNMPDRISGIRLQEVSSGTVRNNYIGTDAAKSVAPNEFDGITLHTNVSNVNVVGNTICNNGTAATQTKYGAGGGVACRESVQNCTFTSNFIGFHADLTPGGNFDYGISIERNGSNNTIGGSTPSEGNSIGNSTNNGTASTDHGCGVWLSLSGNSGNELFNNLISNNVGHGVLIESGASGNIIGASGQGNVITNNTSGIKVMENGAGTTNNNTLRFNSFACNTEKGISLEDQGNNMYGYDVSGTTKIVTVNPNEARANFVSGTAPAGATIDIYSINSTILTTCPANCDADQYQGATFIGQSVVADGTGFWEYDFVAGGNLVDKNTVVVLATETPTTQGTANTSEFSICMAICNAPTNVTINGNDFDLCQGESTELTANANGMLPISYSYSWFKGNDILTGELVAYQLNDSTLSIDEAGTYFVKIAAISDTATCVDSSAGVAVTVNPLPVINVNAAENSLCTGDSVSITSGASGNANESISWSPTGETSANIFAKVGGTHTVTITNTATGCVSSGSANITENSKPTPTTIGGFFCPIESLTLDAGVTNMTYLWSTGETTQSINVDTEGNYKVVVTDPTSGCQDSVEVFADMSDDPQPVVDLGPDDSICFFKQEALTLTANVTAAAGGTYLWSTAVSTDITETLTDTGHVWMTYTDLNGCADTDSMYLFNYCVPPTRTPPNIFVPGSPENPTWRPIGTIDETDLMTSHFEVYNRWGLKMYETDQFPVWDGTYNGRSCNTGVYFWTWVYKDVTQAEYSLNGFIHLMQKK